MVQGLKVYMVGYGPRVNGSTPGSSSGKPLVSLLEYKGFMEIPSGVCHIRSSGFLPFSCFLARAAHSGWRGCCWCRSRCHKTLEVDDSFSCFKWWGESKKSRFLALNMMENGKHPKETKTDLEKEAQFIYLQERGKMGTTGEKREGRGYNSMISSLLLSCFLYLIFYNFGPCSPLLLLFYSSPSIAS